MQSMAEIVQRLNINSLTTLSDLTEEEWKQKKVDAYNEKEGGLTGYDCRVCRNKGDVMHLREYGSEYVTICKCMEIRKSLKNIESSGLKGMIDKCRLDNFKTDCKWRMEMKNKAIDFLNHGGDSWFFIGGQVGSGKTHICTAIAGEMLKRGKSVVYMLWIDESTRIKSIANDDEYSDAVDRMKRAEVLYIDDLFKPRGVGRNSQIESPSQADIRLAFEILNYRYCNDNMVTIISSEREMAEITAIDEAIGSRIYQRCKLYHLDIDKDPKKNYRLG